MSTWATLSRERDERENAIQIEHYSAFEQLSYYVILWRAYGIMLYNHVPHGDVWAVGIFEEGDVIMDHATGVKHGFLEGVEFMTVPWVEVAYLRFSARLMMSYSKSEGFKREVYLKDRAELEEWATTQDGDRVAEDEMSG